MGKDKEPLCLCTASDLLHPSGAAHLETRTHPGKHRHMGDGAPRRGQRGTLSFSFLPHNSFPPLPLLLILHFLFQLEVLKQLLRGCFSQHSCPAQTREAKGASGEKTSWPESPVQPRRPQRFQRAEESPREPTGWSLAGLADRQRAGSLHL